MKRSLAISIAVMTLGGAAWVAIPRVMLMPFKAQTPDRLALSRVLLTSAPLVTGTLLILGLIAVALLWPRLRTWRGRVPTVVAVLVLAVCVFLGRWNTFEAMFHPLPHPLFVEASESKDVLDEDLVLGVAGRDEARAYPVRAMAYHHLVNDVVAGEPIVATY